MKAIKTTVSPKDERGNDPNDWRNDPSYLDKLEPAQIQRGLAWLDAFKLNDREASELVDPEWVYPDLVIRGHVVAIPAPPNGGKTTILAWVCGQIASDYRVIYVNADISGTDAKAMFEQSKRHGWELLTPDFKLGRSMDDVVTNLEQMNLINEDYSSIVFVFDTLKKMTNVIHKADVRKLFKTLRGLSAKGASIVLLAHTNKYPDADGNPVYEGTGDLRADVDDLIYFVPKKNPDGSMTVSTMPDKVRGTFKPLTFYISPSREVTQSREYVDVEATRQVERQREMDETIIEAIIEAIRGGKVKQSEIVAHCKDGYSIGWRNVDRVLKRYSRKPLKLWRREKAFQRNAWNYFLEESGHE